MDFDKLSYSMVFDHDTDVPKTLQLRHFAHYANKRPLAAWVDDTDAHRCQKCNCEFSMFTRRHHCRQCGRIFCYSCCSTWMKIDKETRNAMPSSQSFFASSNEKERVCKECATNLKTNQSVHKLFQIVNLIGLNVQDILTLGKVNRQWNRVGVYYLNVFRNIQYLIPNNVNRLEATMLRNNLTLFRGHSTWLVQACKLMKREENKSLCPVIENILTPLANTSKKCNCWSIRCSRKCSDSLTPEEALLCLESVAHEKCLLKKILPPLFQCSIQELECYIPIILHVMPHIPKECCELIESFLRQSCRKSLVLAHTLFWEYTKAIGRSRSTYFVARTHMIHGLPSKIKKKIHSSYDFVTVLKECVLSCTPESVKKKLTNYSFDKKNHEVTYPLKPEQIVSETDVKNIVQLNSKSKPIIVPIDSLNRVTFDSSYEKFLIKNDDVRKDAIIMNCIILMDKILKTNGINLNIVNYRILALSNEIGMIEIVKNSRTIHDIQKSNFSIQNYIIEHNTTKSIHTVRDNYMKSCAAYCLIGYLLGIGDRHLENIMITETGFIFHIDFEFILGHDPKLIRPEIRITPEMIDAMGGYESRYYNDFQNVCRLSFKCLRRHAAIFYRQLLLLTQLDPPLSDGYTEEFILSQINKRLMVGETHDSAEIQFVTKVAKSSSSSYQHGFVDYLHDKGKTLHSLTDQISTMFGYYTSSSK